MYVALTRARVEVHMSSCERRMVQGIEADQVSSRFVQEIPAECVATSRARRDSWNHWEADDHVQEDHVEYGEEAQLEADAEITPNARVLHRVYGEGVVQRISRQGIQARAVIRFRDGRDRTLLLEYGELKVLPGGRRLVSDRDDILQRMRELADAARALDDAELLHEMRAMLAPAAATADQQTPSWHGIVGESEKMLELRPRIERFAAVAAPVLICGESGTGKELVAHALHALSPRANKTYLSENCAAIPETLLESVLFGHVKGAFTGAVHNHDGHFVAADGGTLFLDEVGDMPLAMQVKLLRALQEGEVRPVGGSKVRKVDVRVLTATNRDLPAMVAEGTFREDLFYRLNVLQLTLPPLRDRGDDVVLLARAFLAKESAKNGRALTLGASAEQALAAAQWPGNVRQLQNEMQRVATLCDGDSVESTDLSPGL